MPDLDFYYPFDSVDSDRTVTAAVERRFWGGLFTSGVVGATDFALTDVSPGVYSIGTGIAVIAGSVGGITAAKQVTANPAVGNSRYIVLRLDTRSSERKITLEAVATLITDTQAQLEQGGRYDIALYKVDNVGGNLGLLDMRTYCSSFDNAQYATAVANFMALEGDIVEAQLTAMLEGGQEDIDALVAAGEAAISGFYGGMDSNAIINGDFKIDQRGGGAAHTVATGQRYTVDRWLARVDGAVGANFTAEPVEFNGLALNQPRTALRLNMTALVGDGMVGFGQFIENGAEEFGGNQLTVGFTYHAAAGQKLCVNAQIRYTATNIVNLVGDVVTGSNDWLRYETTFTIPNALVDESNNIKVTIFTEWAGTEARQRFGTAEDNNLAGTIYLANVVANKGEIAMPYAPQHMADEVARCRRYYRKYGMTTLSAGVMKSDRTCKTQMMDFSGMRQAPTLTVTDRIGVAGKSSVELSTTGMENGHVTTPTSNSDGYTVCFVVQPLTTAQVQPASIVFGSIEADAEYTQ